MSDFPESPYQSQPSSEEPKKSGGGLKIFLWIVGIGGGLLLLACAGCVIGSIVFVRNTVSQDPAVVKKTADEITEITPPSGYEPMFAFNVVVKMAAFGQEDRESPRILMLMAFPSNMADEQQQMSQSLQQQGGQHDLQEIESETRTYTIRGEECQVRIAKAKAENGLEVRQITAIFQGKEGPAMLMLIMPEKDWINGGEQEFEKMLESMK